MGFWPKNHHWPLPEEGGDRLSEVKYTEKHQVKYTANSAGYIELKESYSKAHLPTVMKKCNKATILTYFVQTKADFKVTREESFELFRAGHVHVSKDRCYSKHFTADFFSLKKCFLLKRHAFQLRKQQKYVTETILPYFASKETKKTAKICHRDNPSILCFKRNYQISLNFLLWALFMTPAILFTASIWLGDIFITQLALESGRPFP